MKKATIVVDDFFLNNKLFNLNDSYVNSDGVAYPYYKLQKDFELNGYNLATQDINLVKDADYVLYFPISDRTPKESEKNKSFLLLVEPVVVAPKLYNKKLHAKFNKVFTFCDELVDNKKYFKINFAYNIPNSINKNIIKNKLCCLIAGNKKSKHKLELYAKRIEAIRWFEKNAPDNFDLYGRGWNLYRPKNKIVAKFSNKFQFVYNILSNFFWHDFPSYKGTLEHKIPTLEKYKFSICYENAKDIPGYITEKIFHCFFAGCIPIYWGANNITEYIPQVCFIDRKRFSSYEQYMIT
jgi:alpha(1,3/1,4) fucosyltransferase